MLAGCLEVDVQAREGVFDLSHFVTIGDFVIMPEMLRRVKDGDLRKSRICLCRSFPFRAELRGAEGPTRKDLRNVYSDNPSHLWT